MKADFLKNAYCGPCNEAVEERDANGDPCYRILYDGLEVARVSYAESDEWPELYAKAPEMLAALRRIREAFYVKGTSKALKAALEGTQQLVTDYGRQPA